MDLSSGAADFLEVTVTKETDSKGVSTWKMIFSGGLTAGVQLTNKMFQLVISASASYRTQFEGNSVQLPCFLQLWELFQLEKQMKILSQPL